MRTQIQLTPEQSKRLKSLAHTRKVSVPDLIRQGVDLLVESTRGVSPEERRRRAIAVAGRFRSGRSDLSTRHDDLLAEAYASA